MTDWRVPAAAIHPSCALPLPQSHHCSIPATVTSSCLPSGSVGAGRNSIGSRCAAPPVLRLPAFLRRHGSYAARFHWFASIRRSPNAGCFQERHLLRLLALLSLGHPLGAFPAPCGNFAALLFRFLPQEISRAKYARLRPLRARFLVATFPKSAARPWEQGTLASRCAGCPE